MKSLPAILVPCLLLLCSSTGFAQPGGSSGECPEFLVAIFNGEFVYQLKNCSTGQMTNKTQRFPQKVKLGCNGMMDCKNLIPQVTLVQASYADANQNVFTGFGTAPTSLIGATGTRKLKVGSKVFLVTALRLKGKKTGGADSETPCTIRFGFEVDPSTTHDDTATLTGNTLTYQGSEFTVSLKP